MTRNGASYVKIGSCIEQEKSNTETLFRPRHTGVLRRKLRKRDESRLGFACTDGNKWCHTVEWMCLFSTILPDIYGNIVKRQFLVELEILFSLFLSLSLSRHPLFSFFSRLGVFFLQKAAHFDLEEKKKEKKERSRCQWTKRLETLPTLCFKAIYTLIERRSARGTKRYHPISECTQLRMVARVCYSVIK